MFYESKQVLLSNRVTVFLKVNQVKYFQEFCHSVGLFPKMEPSPEDHKRFSNSTIVPKVRVYTTVGSSDF
jgi:hypothetical protein